MYSINEYIIIVPSASLSKVFKYYNKTKTSKPIKYPSPVKICGHRSWTYTHHVQYTYNLTFIHVFNSIWQLSEFCETQWRHSVKTRLYNTPSPILHSVKRSDVTRWKQGYIRTLSHTSFSTVKTKEVVVIESHRIKVYWHAGLVILQSSLKQLHFGV